jgi:glycosyltransferase involved in cell wall biosynthesis
MRILMLHNRYDIRGGEDESTDCEYRLLRDRGHDIDLLEAHNSDIGKNVSIAEAALSAVWSKRWHGEVTKRLREKSYDIVHVQNFFPLISPSAYFAAKAADVPVVQAIRNYRIVCPSANLFRSGSVCTKCVGTTFKFSGVRHACYRESFSGTATVASMSSIHRMIGTWRTKVSAFLAISNYVKDVLVSDGLSEDLITVKPNFVETDGVSSPLCAVNRKFILYVGRLSKEKGLDMLLEAYARSGVEVPLKLVGEGEVGLNQIEGVEVLGRKSLAEVYSLMSEAYCVVMPGRWPEPFGRVAIESFAAGTPVIATGLGGVAEIVEHGVNGFLVPPGDATRFGDCIRQLICNPQMVEVLAAGATASFRKKYSPDKNYEHLIDVYEKIISNKKKLADSHRDSGARALKAN